jgi:hypothetical protein
LGSKYIAEKGLKLSGLWKQTVSRLQYYLRKQNPTLKTGSNTDPVQFIFNSNKPSCKKTERNTQLVPKDNQDLIKIQQAHDRLFRESMQDIDVARNSPH